MNFNWARLLFAVCWLIAGSAALLRDSVGLTWLSDRYPAEHLNLFGGVAIGFALWNTIRWYAGRNVRVAPRAIAGPLMPKNTEQRPFEYNPELDFMKPETETPESK